MLINHLQAVSTIARHMAACAGFNDNLQACCGVSGYLHDIGKTASGGNLPDSLAGRQ
jgi:HD-GYP domain-containing protein (c-di-GMP phosphodiesterase class II)